MDLLQLFLARRKDFSRIDANLLVVIIATFTARASTILDPSLTFQSRIIISPLFSSSYRFQFVYLVLFSFYSSYLASISAFLVFISFSGSGCVEFFMKFDLVCIYDSFVCICLDFAIIFVVSFHTSLVVDFSQNG